jgi:hypothetical protein
VWREAVVVVDQALGGGGVDFDGVAVALPVGGEDDDGFWFYFLGDFVADRLEFGVGWMGVVFEEVGASLGGVSGQIMDVGLVVGGFDVPWERK